MPCACYRVFWVFLADYKVSFEIFDPYWVYFINFSCSWWTLLCSSALHSFVWCSFWLKSGLCCRPALHCWRDSAVVSADTCCKHKHCHRPGSPLLDMSLAVRERAVKDCTVMYRTCPQGLFPPALRCAIDRHRYCSARPAGHCSISIVA